MGPPCSMQSALHAAVRRQHPGGGGSPRLHDNMPMLGQHRNFKETPMVGGARSRSVSGCACRSGVLPTASRGYFESAGSAWLQHRGGFLGCALAPSAFSSPPSGLDGSGPHGFRAALIGSPAHRRAVEPPGPSPEKGLPCWALTVLRLRFGSRHCAPGLLEADFTLGVFKSVIQDTTLPETQQLTPGLRTCLQVLGKPPPKGPKADPTPI